MVLTFPLLGEQWKLVSTEKNNDFWRQHKRQVRTVKVQRKTEELQLEQHLYTENSPKSNGTAVVVVVGCAVVVVLCVVAVVL